MSKILQNMCSPLRAAGDAFRISDIFVQPVISVRNAGITSMRRAHNTAHNKMTRKAVYLSNRSQSSDRLKMGECSCGYWRNSCIRAVSRNASVPPQSVAENAPHRFA